MKKVFIVTYIVGSYEDVDQGIESVFSTLEEAEAFCRKGNRDSAKRLAEKLKNCEDWESPDETDFFQFSIEEWEIGAQGKMVEWHNSQNNKNLI